MHSEPRSFGSASKEKSSMLRQARTILYFFLKPAATKPLGFWSNYGRKNESALAKLVLFNEFYFTYALSGRPPLPPLLSPQRAFKATAPELVICQRVPRSLVPGGFFCPVLFFCQNVQLFSNSSASFPPFCLG